MRNIGIVAKPNSVSALEYAAGVAADLKKRGLKVLLDDVTAEAMGIPEGPPIGRSEIGKHSDLLISFGGDGTLLSIARHAPDHVPVLGVNMGTLGFLTEVRVDEFPEVLEKVLAGHYESEERVAFDVAVRGPGRDHRTYRVLNDATINKSALARIIEMRVTVGGEFMSSFRADGLIIATPTGSTAYNLSAGGPIIYPTMGAVVLTPICPHMLTNRPVVLPDSLEIEVGIATPNQEIFLTLDGQEGLPIGDRDTVLVKKSPNPVTLIRTPKKSYFDVLRTKLKWGEG